MIKTWILIALIRLGNRESVAVNVPGFPIEEECKLAGMKTQSLIFQNPDMGRVISFVCVQQSKEEQ